MKGIILAGGTGSRLFPATLSTSKQLMAVYDKPMIYYPLSTLMLAGIREILIITTETDQDSFQRLLGDGSDFGMQFEYIVQPKPEGLAQAFLLGEEFIDNSPCALVLGDNIFYGHNLQHEYLQPAVASPQTTIFATHVSSPSAYGVVEIGENGKVISIEEKPDKPKSDLAVTGLYFYDSNVCDMAKQIKPSARGELEISDLNRLYLEAGNLNVVEFGRGIAWLDTGTHETLLQASQFVATIENRQGLKIACLEEIAYNMGYINKDKLLEKAQRMGSSGYGKYLTQIANG